MWGGIIGEAIFGYTLKIKGQIYYSSLGGVNLWVQNKIGKLH